MFQRSSAAENATGTCAATAGTFIAINRKENIPASVCLRKRSYYLLHHPEHDALSAKSYKKNEQVPVIAFDKRPDIGI